MSKKHRPRRSCKNISYISYIFLHCDGYLSITNNRATRYQRQIQPGTSKCASFIKLRFHFVEYGHWNAFIFEFFHNLQSSMVIIYAIGVLNSQGVSNVLYNNKFPNHVPRYLKYQVVENSKNTGNDFRNSLDD